MGNSTKKTNAIAPKIKSLKIENFRGIQNFELNSLGKINIFLGRNGVCKTSILEAIWLNTGGFRNAQNLQILDAGRNILLKNHRNFLNPFYNLDYNNHSKFIFNIENQARQLIIKPMFTPPKIQKSNGSSTQIINQTSSIYSNKGIIGIKFEIKVDNKEYTSSFYLDETEVIINHAKDYNEIYNTSLINNRVDASREIQKLILENKKSSLVEVLQKINKKIINIESVGDDFFVDLGVGNLMPLKLTGEGVVKVAYISACLHNMRNQFLLIDEIENGLHYKSQELVWQIVAAKSFNNNIDCFITSHNKEIMETLSQFLAKKENEKYQKLFKFYTLFRDKDNELKSNNYDFKKFYKAMGDNFEIRGLF